MKAGDKLIYKNETNSTFEIIHIDNNEILILEKQHTGWGNYQKYLKFELKQYGFNYIWEYFYTPQELRQLKLNQLMR